MASFRNFRRARFPFPQSAFKKRKNGAHNSVVRGCWLRLPPGVTNDSHNRVVRSDLERAGRFHVLTF
ncbi:MAG: hypothetical protein C5B50_04625 [Verrucomicrobia bacterium]|nr:MAG: hypothetical protein C5B50_04625 [Verrucomicrobiota bacterium]